MKQIKDIVVFKGYRSKGGVVHFRDITIDDIRSVFFPKTFEEKYRYLGAMIWKEESRTFLAIEPLIIFLDYKAKPYWCPRWVLRFLNLFGMDNSLVRVRNRWMADLLHQLTKGYKMIDWKTKWEWYDLRLSVQGDNQMMDLADAIEAHYYKKGKQIDDNEPV